MKKILAVVLTLVMLVAMAVPAFAAAKVVESEIEGFAFHCNAISGNGRSYIDGKEKDFGKFDKKTGEGLLKLTGFSDSKVWTPLFKEKMVCSTCGSSEWISFSNKSGVPDGKNIQLNHPGESNKIIKEWIKNKSADKYIGVRFFATFEIELSSGKIFTMGPGNFFLPSDLTATVKEIACTDGFRLVDEYNDGNVWTFVNEDLIINSTYYYAACQLYHDILYSFNSSSLDASFYNGHIPFGGVDNWAGDILHPVGLAHRDAIQDYYERNRVDEDVRYDPLPLTSQDADDLRVEWEEKITVALREVCLVLGIDVDAFFAAYGADSIEVQAKYHAPGN